ncbi:MAG: hypothetical protein WD595_05180 [Waddliaceae bacterium]
MASSSVGTLSADPCCYNNTGYGYQDCCRAPCISPYVALGVVTVAAVIAVLVNNKKSDNGHLSHD